jgi:drug/metabolite transporter (DMT)-like permease
MLNPYLELVIVSLIFGSSGAVIKYLHLPPTTMTFFRMAVPTIVLFVYLYFKKIKLFRKNFRLVLIASFLNAIRLLFFFMGYTLASIGNATIASSVGPLFVFLYSLIFLKEKATLTKITLLCTALIGIIILYSNKTLSFSDKDFLGMSFALIASAIYSLTIVIYKKELDRYSKTETVFYQNFVGAFLFLPFIFINKPFPEFWQIGFAVTSQFFIGLVAFVMFFSALKKVTPTVASIATFDSVISVILGIILFKEVLTVNMVIGGILILFSSVMIKREIV